MMINRRKDSKSRGSLAQPPRSKSRQRSQSLSKNASTRQQQQQKSLKKVTQKKTSVSKQYLYLQKPSSSKNAKRGVESMDLSYCQGYRGTSNLDMFSIPTGAKKRKGLKHFSPHTTDQFTTEKTADYRSASSQRKKPTKNRSNVSSPYLNQNNEEYQNTNVLSYTEDDDYGAIGKPMIKQKSASKRDSASRKKTPSRENKYSSQQKISHQVSHHSTTKNDRDYQDVQKDLIEAKSQLYEYKYKLDKYKKRFGEAQRHANESNLKFQAELEKSDEFFTKAEKYKVVAKDYRKEVEKLKLQIESYQNDYDEIENFIRNKEMVESKATKDRQFILQELLMSLRQLQKTSSQIDKQGQLIMPINQIFESVKILNKIDTDISQQPTKMNTESTLGIDGANHYIGDGKHKYKISQDAIIYNSETLGTNCEELRASNSVQQSHTPMIQQFNQYSHGQSYQQENVSISNNPSNNSSIREGDYCTSQQQYEILMKIQEEMTKIKEDSHQVLHENHALKDQNNLLNSELQMEKQRIEQSLLPQYKDAFDQLRKANEVMQKKIEDLENERKDQNNPTFNQNITYDLNDLKLKISKFEYENQNLREERDLFMQQIQSLETFNKNQEKMINYFQSGVIQAYQTQPIINQENFDLQNFLNKRQKSSTQNFNNGQIQRIRQTTEQTEESVSDLTKSQAYYTNRSGEPFSVQPFTLNQKTSEINLQSSQASQNNQRLASKGKYPAPLNINSDSSLYIETAPNDKSDILISGENEHLFSLSSTQPEHQMRLQSPMNGFAPKQIDFNSQQLIASINAKETFGSHIIQMQQSYFPKTSTHQNYKTSKDQISIEEAQCQSQEVTNRDKSLIKSASHLSSTNQFYYMKSDNNDQSISQESKEDDESIDERNAVKSKKSGLSNLESDRSLEHHILMLRKGHQQNLNQLQSQETFQVQSHQASVKDQMFSKATTNKNSHRSKYHQYLQMNDHNKENQSAQIEDDFSGFTASLGPSKNMKIKSPAFQQESNNNSDTETYNQMNSTNENQLKKTTTSYHNTQTLSQNTNGGSNSVNSNYMSERTMNLKKEITSLDEEIYMLQNSLKQALLKKGSDANQ